MTEKERYFNILVENLYVELRTVSECTFPNKSEIAAEMIFI